MEYEAVSQSSRLFNIQSTALQRKIFYLLGAMFITIAAITVPFGKLVLYASPSFMLAMYLTVICFDVVTAIILLNLFRANANLPILILSAAYSYSALILIPGVLTFPGLFVKSGLLHAGPQTAAWIYSFWQFGFALMICSYLILHKHQDKNLGEKQARLYSVLAWVIVPSIVVLLTFISLHASELLPNVFNSNGTRTVFYKHYIAPIVLLLGLLAFSGTLFIHRGRSVMSLFLTLALLASFLNVFLNVYSSGRFTLGWYVAIFNSFLSSTILLIFLLYEFNQIFLLATRASAALAASKATAESASSAKSAFLANMSHEIRTPINAIMGLNYLLQQTSLSVLQKDYVSKSIMSTRTLLNLVNDILDFSKIEAGKVELEHIDFDLYEAINDVSDLVCLKAYEKGLRLHFTIDHRVPQILVGDPFRLKQVLLNLVNNALKFTDEGEVTVSVCVQDVDQSRYLLLFSVQDTGIGMTNEQMTSLFQEFTQLDMSTTRKYGGTGLGLSISKNLVELMGGQLSATSQAGAGSRFDFTVELEESKTVLMVLSEMKFVRVLLICDITEMQQVLKKQLEQFKFIVCIADSEENAIHQLDQTGRYDLILIDWSLQGADVIRLAEMIKRRHADKLPPQVIVLVSAYHELELRGKAQSDVFEKVMFFPISQSQLFNEVITLLQPQIDTQRQNAAIPSVEPKEMFTALRGSSILLVEDNEINQLVAREVLREMGIFVEIADNGAEALRKLGEFSFDAVIMDLQMPVMDGFETTKRIRMQDTFKDLPIIAMTADAMVGVKEKVLEAGMDGYVTKPFDPIQLYSVIHRYLQASRKKSGVLEVAAAVEEVPGLSLPGLDVEAALQLLGKNEELYRRILMTFTKHQQGGEYQILQAIEDGDRAKAILLSHSLKGAASNLGAYELAKAASMLQQELENLEEATALEPALGLDEVEVQTAIVLRSVAAYLRD